MVTCGIKLHHYKTQYNFKIIIITLLPEKSDVLCGMRRRCFDGPLVRPGVLPRGLPRGVSARLSGDSTRCWALDPLWGLGRLTEPLPLRGRGFLGDITFLGDRSFWGK